MQQVDKKNLDPAPSFCTWCCAF